MNFRKIQIPDPFADDLMPCAIILSFTPELHRDNHTGEYPVHIIDEITFKEMLQVYILTGLYIPDIMLYQIFLFVDPAGPFRFILRKLTGKYDGYLPGNSIELPYCYLFDIPAGHTGKDGNDLYCLFIFTFFRFCYCVKLLVIANGKIMKPFILHDIKRTGSDLVARQIPWTAHLIVWHLYELPRREPERIRSHRVYRTHQVRRTLRRFECI